MKAKTVCIIGSGLAGLSCAQSCLALGMEPILLEKDSELGGLWKKTCGKTWHGLEVNISRYNMEFSNFAWEDGQPDFPTNDALLQYLSKYAAHFKLEKYVEYNSQVVSVSFSKYEKKWIIKINQKEDIKTDALVVANGIFHSPFKPKIKGIANFKNLIIHSQDYKTPEQFRNKRVVIIGGGMSGTEIASSLASSKISCTHLFRKPFWVIKRLLNSIPFDMLSYNYPNDNYNALSSTERSKRRIDFIDETFGNPGSVDPKLRIERESLYPHPFVVSDYYYDQIKEGLIKPMLNSISYFTTQGIKLLSGEVIRADVVILCTGYQSDLTILNKELQNSFQYKKEDFLQPFIADHATLLPSVPRIALVGNYRAPYLPAVELQGRLAAAVFTEEVNYVDSKKSRLSLQRELNTRVENPRPALSQNYVSHALGLAKLLNVLPQDLLELAKTVNTPICPADFRRFGIQSDFSYAENRRKIFLQRIAS